MNNITSWPIAAIPKTNPLCAAFEAHYREHPITADVARMVSARAWRLSQRVVDGETLRPELEQRLLLAVCRAADSWDSTRGSYLHWVRGALDFCQRQLIDAIQRRTGRWARTIWIDSPTDEAATAIIDLVSINGVNRMLCEIDLRACAEWLSPLYRRILTWLVQGWNRSAIARFLDMPRATFDRKIWGPFMQKMEEFYA